MEHLGYAAGILLPPWTLFHNVRYEAMGNSPVCRFLLQKGQRLLSRNLAAGQKGLSVAFDLAAHRGYDADHPSGGDGVKRV